MVGRPCARMGELRVWDVVEGVLILCGFEGGRKGEREVGGAGGREGGREGGGESDTCTQGRAWAFCVLGVLFIPDHVHHKSRDV